MDASPLVLVTGATDGIGKETAVMLANYGARVIVHGRTQEKVHAAAEEVAERTGVPWVGEQVADFCSLTEVRFMAEQIAATHEQLDGLVNNAGVCMREYEHTREGYEVTLAVNYLSHFLLTHLLLPQLERSPSGRIVNVSSNVHLRCRFDVNNLQGEQGWEDSHSYATSKLAQVLFTSELARRVGHTPVSVNAVHPGIVATKLLREGFGIEGQDPLAKGAATSVMLIMGEEGGRISGKYWSEGMVARAHPLAGDPLTCGRFYDRTAAMVGIPPLPKPMRKRVAERS
jgi:NAD(P)-dependent dehydrogenase (short-subunit alcohol dehydrogenase family)